MMKVIEALYICQKELQNTGKFSENTSKRLLEATDHMLDSLMEHMDDCAGILRSFFPKTEKKKFTKAFSQYKKSVEPYRTHIGNIDNYLKHNQGRLRLVSFEWQEGSSLGYFIEGPLSDNTLGPIPQIHPGSNSAFSYFKNLPFHICSIFAVSSRLTHTLHSIDRKIISSQRNVISQNSELRKVLELVSAFPPFYFPDELSLDFPAVEYNNGHLNIEYPSDRVKPLAIPTGSRFITSYVGDGVTRSFKMPYHHLSDSFR